MNKAKNVEELLNAITKWAEECSSIASLALVGSYAIGKEREDSDIDLAMMSNLIEHSILLSRA